MKKALITLAAFVGYSGATEFCWKDTYSRGDGVPVHVCPAGTERDGALCYPPCRGGYHGVGPVCWANCEGGMHDAGVTCQKQSYGRGAGRAIHVCPPGTEQNGALCYPTCGAGYHGVGPVCWQACPGDHHDDGLFCRKDAHIYGKGCCCFFGSCCHGKCPSDYHEDPCTCRRDAHIFTKGSYGRGAGHALGCAGDEDLNGGLCYPKARPGYTGNGPVAWQNCVGNTRDAGAFCTKDTYGRTAGVPLICDPASEDMDKLFCYKKCRAGYKLINNGWCVVDCPAGWVDCGAGCAVDQAECDDKIKAGLTGDLAQVADNVASAIAANKAKHNGNIDKVTRLANANPAFMTRLRTYANHIKDIHVIRTGVTLNDEQSLDYAKQATGAIMSGMEARGHNTDNWAESMQYIEAIDPTGVLGSAKTFELESCNTVHLS